MTQSGMGSNSVEQEVRFIISRIAKTTPDRLRPDTDLRTELAVDSLMGLQIVAALEKRFGITVPDDELDSYGTVQQIVDTVMKHYAPANNDTH